MCIIAMFLFDDKGKRIAIPIHQIDSVSKSTSNALSTRSKYCLLDQIRYSTYIGKGSNAPILKR